MLKNGWKDSTPDKMRKNSQSREYTDPTTNLRVRFDPGKKEAKGFEGIDHYHVYNKDRTGKYDYYLDKEGKPVAKGSKASHIIPREE